MSAVFPTAINLELLEYKPPQNNKSGQKNVYISTVPGSTNPQNRLRFQMSETAETDEVHLQTAVWGLSTPLPNQDASRRTLVLTIESPALLDFLNRLDAQNLQKAYDNAQKWFGMKKPPSRDEIKQYYHPIVMQPARDGDKPTVRVKVKVAAAHPTQIFKVSGHKTYVPGTPADLVRNSKCCVVADTVGLWFMPCQFGMCLVATEILVWSNQPNVGMSAFTFASGSNWQAEAACDAAEEEMFGLGV